MSWATLSQQTFDLVDNNKTALGIQEVYRYPKFDFSGYPACTVTPSDNSNDYETTSENVRIYAWKVRIFYDTKATGIDASLQRLYPVIDDTMDQFDKEDEQASGQVLGVGMPAGYTYINNFATPGVWLSTENENIFYNEFTIRIRVSVDIQ